MFYMSRSSGIIIYLVTFERITCFDIRPSEIMIYIHDGFNVNMIYVVHELLLW